jgi:CRISPR-associated endonuclease Csn1
MNHPETQVRRILALDIGIGSFGIALQERRGDAQPYDCSFPLVRSCTLPADWAELKVERTRRRMWRTRQAHQAREHWLREVFVRSGLEKAVLYGRRSKCVTVGENQASATNYTKRRWVLDVERPADFRLEREYPPREGTRTRDGAPSDAEGARTIYSGAALRCLLLLGEAAQVEAQGRPLEPWQVFKALHSAIQKRGYDPKVPWARGRNSGNHSEAIQSTKSGECADSDGNPGEISEVEKNAQMEEQASLERALTMQGIVEGLSAEERFQHPCFWEAWRMGLWDPATPGMIRPRQNHLARSCKWADQEDPANRHKKGAERDPNARLPAIFPRRMVEAELLALCEGAARLIPALHRTASEIPYGPTGIPYPNIPRRDPAEASDEAKRLEALNALSPDLRRRFVRGKEAEWMGALTQKAPTFDNRGPGSCALIPRLNVAKCDLRYRNGEPTPESILPSEVSFLLQAKNFRFVPEILDSDAPAGFRDRFTASEVKKLYEDHFMPTVLPRIQEGRRDHAMMHNRKNLLTVWLEKNIGPKTTAKPGTEGKGKAAIDTPKATGRSRFSRPALRLVKELVLSGLDPAQFRAELLDRSNSRWEPLRAAIKLTSGDSPNFNQDPMRGLMPADLGFLDNIGASWDKLSIRDERLETIAEKTQAEEAVRQAAITNMIALEINPKIRHRLQMLDRLLSEVVTEFGAPDRVVLEFAREEWLGPKRRQELLAFQNERKNQNISARLELGGDRSAKSVLKHQLLKEQGGLCLFCGKNYSSPNTVNVAQGELSFDNAHLAHIVADAKGGPRAYVNLVLACDGCNRAQDTLYHADAFAQARFPTGWDSFLERVRHCQGMRPFKKKLLSTRSQEDATGLIQNKTALQETAWIAKLTRVLISLKFGWRLDSAGEERRIVVVTGSVTNRVATKYGLYALLGGPKRVADLEKDKSAIETALRELETAPDDEVHRIGDELAKAWKFKKRKNDPHWERDHLIRLLRRLQLEKEDTLNEKDRRDARHHALDAMILSFLPHWAGNPGKSLFFGLPPGKNWKEEFRIYLEKLYPEVLISARPELEASLYGARRVGLGSAATKRFALRDLAYTGINPSFSETTLKKQAKNIYDGPTRTAVLRFVATQPTEADWLDYCARLASHGLRPGGPTVTKVRCVVSEQLTEYADFSKDGTGAWRRGDKNQGWFICELKKSPGKYAIKPVYVHQSKGALEQRIRGEGLYQRIVGYFVRDEVVVLDRDITGILDPLPAGKFLIRSMRLNGQVELSNNSGTKYNPVQIDRLMDAGFRKSAHA